jgi:nicotinamidase-related amidase
MKSALLIIDVQEGLFSPEPGPADAAIIIERINRLASRARAGGLPVIYVQHEQPGTPVEFGSAGWQLDKRLCVNAGDRFIRKTTPDSFLRTALQALLSSVAVDHLVICGYASEFCVDTTVRRAAALGFNVSLVSDAHTTHDKAHMTGAQIRAHHNATLPEITSFGGTIEAVPAESCWPPGQP